MRAVLTRDDFFVPLHMRVQKARRIQSDLFVSIMPMRLRVLMPMVRRCLCCRTGLKFSGALSGAKENSADLVGGVNIDVKDPMLARTLLDLSQTATINDSLKLGKAVLNELRRH